MNQTLIDLLHLLLCQTPHVYDMMKFVQREEKFCYYYLEHDIAGGQEMPDHAKWLDVVENFKTSLSIKSDKEALEFVKQAIQISQTIRTLANGNEGKMNFIQAILT